MRTLLRLVVTSFFAASSLAAAAEAPAAKPNVIVILLDDLGTIDLNCFGSRDIVTPNIDALAASGVRFTQFYAAAPVCSASRAGLMTGRYPYRAGIPGNVGSTRGDRGLAPEQITLAETFKAAGYATGHIGKWHLGYDQATMPQGQGFDSSFGHMGGCIDNFSHFFYWQGPNRHDLYRNGVEVHLPGRHFSDLMLDEARQFIDAQRDRPFFLYYASNGPHYPYQGDPKWLEHYKELPHPRNLYAAFVSSLDERIGALLGHLKDRGLSEKTIVVFQSDHGHSTEERAHFGGGSAGDYRGAKFSLFEGGIRVPAILAWPGHIPAGETRTQVAHGCDWFPTLAELAGVPLLSNDIDGQSLVPVLRSAGAPEPHTLLHWQFGRGDNAQWAVREGDWKLIGNVNDSSGKLLTEADKQVFLSNVVRNPAEDKNFAAEEPAIVERLRNEHTTWVEEVDAQTIKE